MSWSLQASMYRIEVRDRLSSSIVEAGRGDPLRSRMGYINATPIAGWKIRMGNLPFKLILDIWKSGWWFWGYPYFRKPPSKPCSIMHGMSRGYDWLERGCGRQTISDHISWLFTLPSWLISSGRIRSHSAGVLDKVPARRNRHFGCKSAFRWMNIINLSTVWFKNPHALQMNLI